MKVIDCFGFYNELKMLKFRLTEHNDFVDTFILVESTKTYGGNTKPLYFQENKHLFTEFLHKIIHVVVEDMPDHDAPNIAWLRETHQRRCIHRGIEQLTLDDKDIILISDLDEIFNHEYVQALKQLNQPFALHLNFVTYYYDLEHLCDEIDTAVRALTYDNYKLLGSRPDILRCAFIFQQVHNAGWHFSYFGDAKFIQNKLINAAHQEYNKSKFLNIDEIQECITSGKDICHRDGYTIHHIPLEKNTSLPRNYKMLL